MFQRPSGPAIRGIQEGEYVSKTFWPCPSWVSKKGNHLLQFMISSRFFSHLFRLSERVETPSCDACGECFVVFLWTFHPIFATGVS